MKPFFTSLFLLFATCSYSQLQDRFYTLDSIPVYKLSQHQDTNIYAFTRVPFDSSATVNYLQNLAKLVVNKQALLSSNARNPYFQQLGTQLSFIGDYKRAVIMFDSCDYDEKENEALSLSAFLPGLRNVTFTDARQVILDSARRHQMVMINEAHHFSRHRVLTYSLLQDLYNQGYRYFGLEAVGPYQYDQQKTISVATGYYTMEPIMADLVRYAGEIGFTVFPYEAMSGLPMARDSIQAANIAAVVGDLSKGKLLIHAGYGHIAEKNFGVPVLGQILKELLHTDPFTVNQVDFIEGARNDATQGLYKRLASARRDTGTMPLAMFRRGKPYQISPGDSLYDIFLYTPPATYLQGRPTWLIANGSKSRHTVPLPTSALFLAQAYFEKETVLQALDRCIPADQTYIFNKGAVDFYLRKGTYLVVFRDCTYKVIDKKTLIVE